MVEAVMLEDSEEDEAEDLEAEEAVSEEEVVASEEVVLEEEAQDSADLVVEVSEEDLPAVSEELGHFTAMEDTADTLDTPGMLGTAEFFPCPYLCPIPQPITPATTTITTITTTTADVIRLWMVYLYKLQSTRCFSYKDYVKVPRNAGCRQFSKYSISHITYCFDGLRCVVHVRPPSDQRSL
ncbi:uncharacterized protein LOC108030020 [Drosophila biarmipes]|uniref:uncharacterized protein LOC108030020 n=1 Tax=Drosophila biarmipes TaxID=125945 RepID=UPI0007E770B5|nr:uncharacterized protein LOC108030020 [Drosophila biarmipes]